MVLLVFKKELRCECHKEADALGRCHVPASKPALCQRMQKHILQENKILLCGIPGGPILGGKILGAENQSISENSAGKRKDRANALIWHFEPLR